MNNCSSLFDLSPLTAQKPSTAWPGWNQWSQLVSHLLKEPPSGPQLGFSSIFKCLQQLLSFTREGPLLHQGRTSQPQLGWPLRLPSALHGLLRAAQQALCMLCIALHRLRGNPDPAKSMVIGPAAAMGMGPRDISYKARIFLIFHIATWNWQCRLKHGHCKKGHLALRQYKYHNLICSVPLISQPHTYGLVLSC